MRCNNCGSDVQSGMKFCGVCGTKLQDAAGAKGNSSMIACAVCGLEAPSGTKFCGGCGSAIGGSEAEIGLTYVEENSGVRGSKEQHARVKYYYGKGARVKEAAGMVERFLYKENLITQTLNSGNGYIIQGKQKGNIFKTALGLDMAVTITLIPEGNDLKSSIGAGKWMDKAIGTGIGLLIFWPSLLTTGWGIYMQQKLFSKIEAELEYYLSSVY